MNRRQTLSNLTASDLNITRDAVPLGGKLGRASIGGARRQSIGVGMTNAAPVPRKSSVGLNGPTGRSSSLMATTTSKDPRNIGDKSYVPNSVRILQDFLVQHNFDQPVSRNLTKPTTKDFTTIALFMIQLYDPNFQPTGKIEDEIITFCKFMGYPFSISKTNIAAVGAPHAWPSLLAVLMWLIELIEYNNGARDAENSNEEDVDLDDPSVMEKNFYSFLRKSYGAFILGNDDLSAALEDQFIGHFESKNLLIKDQMEAMSKRNAALQLDIEETKRRSAYLPDLEAKTREMRASFQRFAALTDEMKQKLDLLKMKVDGRKMELEKLNVSMAASTKEIASLRDKINNQELSPEDVTNMLNEKQRLEDAQQAAATNRQNLQTRIWELETSLRESVQTLEETVRAYHSIAEDLKLVPQSARNARGENLSIEIDIRAKKREGLLKTEVRKAILPVLGDLRRELNDTTLSLRSELLAEQDVAEEVLLKQAELRDGIEAYEAKMKRAEATYKREKESLDQGISTHAKEVEELEARLQQLREVAPDDTRIALATRRINETNSIRSARKQEHARKKAAMIDSIMDVVSLCASHRENVQAQLEEVKGLYSARLETFLSSSPLNMDAYLSISKELFQSSSSAVTLRDHIPSSSGKKALRSGGSSGGRRGVSVIEDDDDDDSFPVDASHHMSPKFGDGSGMKSFGDEPFSPIAAPYAANNRNIILSEEKSMSHLNESAVSDVEATMHNLSRIVPDPDPRRTLTYNFEAVA